MLGLPYATHRSLIEPLTGEQHIMKVLVSRFLGFMDKIASSKKKAVKMLMETSRRDIRSVTGQNFRNIMILAGKTCVEEIKKEDAKKIEYFPMDENDRWKVNVIKEIIEVKNNRLDIDNFELEELDEILTYLCTS